MFSKPREGFPIRYATIGIIVSAMALMAAVLVAAGWLGTRQILLDAAWRSARETGQLINERALRTTAPASALLRTLTFDPLLSARSEAGRLSRVDVLIASLLAAPLITAIYVAYDDGDFLLVRPLNTPFLRQHFKAQDGAAFLVQSIRTNPDGTQQRRYDYYDADSQPLSSRLLTGDFFDPRLRHWYHAAQQTRSTVISKPYVFFSSREVGISLSRRAANSHAVIGMDIGLDDLIHVMDRLRMTPGTEIALVDEKAEVILYQDMLALFEETDQPLPARGDAAVPLRPLEALNRDALLRTYQSGTHDEVVALQADGKEWLGLAIPFTALGEAPLQLLLAMPTDELLHNLKRHQQRLILISILLILPFLFLGWRGGSFIARHLERITARTRQLSRFDFQRLPVKQSSLQEINTLNAAVNDVSDTVEALLETSRILNTEKQIGAMLEQLLEKLLSATRCQGGAAYLWLPEEEAMERIAARGDQSTLAARFPYPCPAHQDGSPNPTEPRQGWFELRSRDGGLQGLLILAQPDDPAYATPEFMAFANRLSSMLAVAIEMRQLIESQKALFDAIIQVLADAIDAKSPYTGGHCHRVPELAIQLADQLAAEDDGPYASFRLDDTERYAFHLAAWLHDCGKIISPEHIVNKATKLETIYNRIHEIRMRFEVLWRDAEIACLQAQLDGADPAAARRQQAQLQAALLADFGFVASCNNGSENLADAAIARLNAIAAQTWERHFDDSLGLSTEETLRLANSRPCAPALPATEPLLADRHEHIVPWGARRPAVQTGDPANTQGFDMPLPDQQQHLGELHNLGIRRGTLSEEDRFAINDHVVQTLLMLKKLPWPHALARVPDMAANHHEKMDGSGYPRRLPAGQLPLTDRILTVADIFEALTASDRPYKPAKTLSESLHIMALMCREGHLDPDLYLYFLHSPIWRNYAEKHMLPEQRDTVDTDALSRLAQGTD